MDTLPDNPGVIIRPPLLYLIAFVVVLVLRWLWPLRLFANAALSWLGLAIIVPAVAIGLAGRRALQAAGTNINPGLPTNAIVTSGPYRFSRNPLYVCIALVFVGLTLVVNTWWGLVVLVPVLLLMHHGVVRREERYLDLKFGEAYRQYRSSVRRYL